MSIGNINAIPWYLRLGIFMVLALVVYGGFWYFVTKGTRKETNDLQEQISVLQKANAAIEGLVASAQSSLHGLAFTTEVTSGRAFDEIVNRARQWKANLIVLGSKGTTLLEEIIVGGTAEAVTREAPCSVLVVRPDHKH